MLGGEGVDRILGGSGSDDINGGAGNDVLNGGTGDDEISGGAGNDEINGGGDDDVAVYAGSMADYKVEYDYVGIEKVTDLKASDGDEGVDTLSQIETVRFADGELSVSYDADGEMKVSSYPFNNQYQSSVVGLVGGGYVVTWTDQSGHGEGSSYDVRGQMYESNGVAIGSEFLVNSYTSHYQWESSVGALSGGGFVVAWRDDYGSQHGGSSVDVFAQRYDASGAALGGEFMVNTYTSSSQYEPSVSGVEGGGFVVVWRDDSGHGGGSGGDIRGQRFAANGDKVGDEFRVNTNKSGNQYQPMVAGLDGVGDAVGGFVVAWTDPNGQGGGSSNDVWAKVYNADGTPAEVDDENGNPTEVEFRVNHNHKSGSQYWPSVAALDNGKFVVAWRNDQGGSHDDGTGVGSSYDVWARVFNADGSQVTNEFRVNSHVSSYQYEPSVSGLGDGGFLVSWSSNNQDGSGYGVYAQRYNASGARVGEEFQVNTYTSNNQFEPWVSSLAGGGFVVSWTSYYQDGSNYGVYSQRYDVDAMAISTVRLTGGAGNEQLGFVDPQSEMLVDLGAGNDTLTLGNGADNIRVKGVDNVSLGGGNDKVTVEGDAAVTINGGAGDDTYVVNVSGTVIVEAANGGNDTVISRAASYTLGDNVETLRLAEGGLSGTGNSANNNIIGSTGNDVLSGGGGDDTLVGGLGEDVAKFGGAMLGYDIDVVNNKVTDIDVSDGNDGTDTLSGIEIIRFGDGGELSFSSEGSDEFRANSWVASDQYHPSVAGLAGGNYVVTWQDSSGHSGGSGWDVRGQLYSKNGASIGGEFRVNTYTSSSQYDPSVAGLAGGGFVVTWRDDSGHSGGSGADIRGQRYGADGAALGSEFRVNTYTSSSQYEPSVAGLGDGGFVVTWRDDSGHDGGSGADIRGQRYAADGTAAGDEFRVNTYKSSTQYWPSVAGLGNGGFVVSWSSNSQDGSNYGVYAQRYAADGTTVGAEFRVNSHTGGQQYHSSVTGLGGGGFVVTWRDDSGHSGGSGVDVRGQVYDANGAAVGGEFMVNTYFSGSQYEPSVASLSGGGFVVSWRDDNGSSGSRGGSSVDVFCQVYNATGARVGDEFRVNSFAYNTQYWPSVASLSSGGFVVAWSSRYQEQYEEGLNGGSSYGVYVQQFDADGTAAGVTLLGAAKGEELSFSSAQDGLIASLGGGNDKLTLGSGNDSVVVKDVEMVELGGGNDLVSVGEGSQARQLDVVRLSGTIEAGDVYTVTVDGSSASYRVKSGDTLEKVREGLVDAVNHAPELASVVTAADGGGDDEIYLRANEAGAPQEFLVNTDYQVDHQYYPSIAALKNGGFVVSWRDEDGSNRGGGSSDDVFGQRYDASGMELGDEFRVNQYTSSNQRYPSMAGLKNGGFVVAWEDTSGHDGGSGYDIWARVFDAEGAEAFPEFRVNKTHFSGSQYFPVVAALDNGKFVVVWRNDQGSSHNDGTGAGNGYDVWARVLNADGTEAVAEFRVNKTHVSGSQYEPSVSALDGGGFVVAWRNDNGNSHNDGTGAGSGYDVWARAFNADGTQVTPEFRVNSYTGGSQYQPSVAGLDGGGFVVVWRDDDGNAGSRGGSSRDIFGQRYGANGAAVGDEFLVNTYTSSYQVLPCVIGLPGGGFVVSWSSSNQDGSGYGVYAQSYNGSGARVGDEFRVNSLTSSDQTNDANYNGPRIDPGNDSVRQ